MPNFWRLGGLSWRQLGERVWHEIGEDDVFGQAAKMSFYFLLALFPLLLFLTNLLGYFAQSAELRDSLLEYFRQVLPRSAFHLVVDTLDQVTEGVGRGKMSAGILVTIWAASNGMAALSGALNAAYEVRDERPWWKSRLITIGLTIAFAFFTVTALVVVLSGGRIGMLLAASAGMGRAFGIVWNIVRWPIVLLIVLIAVNLLYRFAPDLKDWKWRWMTPGALIAVGLWISASLGFRFYLRYFNSYNRTYGSLGAVIILLLWFYITSIAILTGAEVNSEIESAASERGEPNARLPGEKRAGERRLRKLLGRFRPQRQSGADVENPGA
jgi:membrane protein